MAARSTSTPLGAFADHVVSFIDTRALRPLQVVADTANGMGGLIVPKVFERLPVDLEVMYGELDGTFPNHPADPMQPANQTTSRPGSRRPVPTSAWPSTATPTGCSSSTRPAAGLSGSTTTAMLAVGVLAKEPGATILHNCICSRAVPEVVREHGGVPVRTRVGHSFIKQVMAETGAAFGGEHSAHYYFRDNFRADSGIIATMFLLEELLRRRPAAVGACASPTSATPPRARSTPRSTTRTRSSSGWPPPTPTGRRTASTASPSTAARGGSTCGRRTPSRCCG